MESFFNRLEKYINVRPSAAMKDIIVKIMVEVLSILGIVTKEVRQGRTSMSVRLIYLQESTCVQREVSQEANWKEGCRKRASAAGQIDARGGSYGCSGNPDDHSRHI